MGLAGEEMVEMNAMIPRGDTQTNAHTDGGDRHTGAKGGSGGNRGEGRGKGQFYRITEFEQRSII